MSKFTRSIFLAALTCASAGANAGDIFIRQDAGQSVVLSNVPETDGFSVLVVAPPDPVVSLLKALAAPLTAPAVVSGSLMDRARRYVPWVDEAARDAKVDARLLHAVIAAESAYNPRALSSKGAVGMMQLLPGTARRYGVADSQDARQNIGGGARYLADLLRLFHNDTQLALAAYNAGENAVLRHGGKVPPYAETEAYVPRVMAFYSRFALAAL
jgi:soluble lytic murein transglycosylase-like protein